MKYKVQMEFDVSSIDLMEVDVEAGSKAEAVDIAIKNYNSGSYDDEDMYASDYYEVSMNKNIQDWIVEKEEKCTQT